METKPLIANTAIGAAFEKAGVIPPTARLQTVATSVLLMSVEEWTSSNRSNWDDPAQRTRLLETSMQAMKKNPRNWEGARDSLYKAIRGDAELLWALFEPYRSLATQRLLTDAATLLRSQDGRALEMKLDDVQKRTRDGARPQAERWSEPAIETMTPKEAAPAAPSNLSVLADKQAIRAAATVVTTIRLSKLDQFIVNGRPIGDLTPEEANAWAGSRERDARFIRLLTQNLPAGRPIREFIRGEEADDIYQRAEKQRAA